MAETPQQPDAQQLLGQYKIAVAEAFKILNQIEEGVDRFHLKSSEVLVGVSSFVIAFIGLTAVLSAWTSLPIIGTALFAVLGGSALAVTGILAFRGPRQWRLEKELRKLETVLASLRKEMAEIKAIPGFSQDILEELDRAYMEAIRIYRKAQSRLAGRKKELPVSSTIVGSDIENTMDLIGDDENDDENLREIRRAARRREGA